MDIADFVRGLIDVKRDQPADDMLSVLVHEERDGRRMTEQEITGK